MGELKCVLCCGLVFQSAANLLNHLERYLQLDYHCPLCTSQVYGIEEIRKHLKVHCNSQVNICRTDVEVNPKLVSDLEQNSLHCFIGNRPTEGTFVGHLDCKSNAEENDNFILKSQLEGTYKFKSNSSVASTEVFEAENCVNGGLEMHCVQDSTKYQENHPATMNVPGISGQSQSLGHDNTNSIGLYDSDLGKEIPQRNCPVCSEYIKNSVYRKHLWEHQKRKEKFPCKICRKEYQHLNSYEQHIAALHEGRQGFICEICGKVFKSKQGMNSHRLKHEGERKFSCSKCEKKFYQFNTLKTHMDTHNSKTKLKCSVCGNQFKTEKSLANHIKNLHSSLERCFCCHMCGLTFKSKYNFKDHMSIHNPDSQYKCKFCDKSFTKYTSKYQHERRLHTKVGRSYFVCEQCEKHFRSKSSLQQHMKLHRGTKDHQCLDCSKKFATLDILKNHVLIHQGVKPFKCEQCSKKFRQKTTYISHLRLHTGEKPYDCVNCGKKFRHRASIRNHQCNGEESYHCGTCGQIFQHKARFKSHCCGVTDSRESFSGKTQTNGSCIPQLLPSNRDDILVIDESGNSEAVILQNLVVLNLDNSVGGQVTDSGSLTLQIQDTADPTAITSSALETNTGNDSLTVTVDDTSHLDPD